MSEKEIDNVWLVGGYCSRFSFSQIEELPDIPLCEPAVYSIVSWRGASLTSFELNRLLDYDEQSILAEFRRVASLITTPIITGRAFDRLSKVDSSTIRKRFGGWRNALEKAGLGHRYSGAVVTERMKRGGAKKQTTMFRRAGP